MKDSVKIPSNIEIVHASPTSPPLGIYNNGNNATMNSSSSVSNTDHPSSTATPASNITPVPVSKLNSSSSTTNNNSRNLKYPIYKALGKLTGHLIKEENGDGDDEKKKLGIIGNKKTPLIINSTQDNVHTSIDTIKINSSNHNNNNGLSSLQVPLKTNSSVVIDKDSNSTVNKMPFESIINFNEEDVNYDSDEDQNIPGLSPQSGVMHCKIVTAFTTAFAKQNVHFEKGSLSRDLGLKMKQELNNTSDHYSSIKSPIIPSSSKSPSPRPHSVVGSGGGCMQIPTSVHQSISGGGNNCGRQASREQEENDIVVATSSSSSSDRIIVVDDGDEDNENNVGACGENGSNNHSNKVDIKSDQLFNNSLSSLGPPPPPPILSPTDSNNCISPTTTSTTNNRTTNNENNVHQQHTKKHRRGQSISEVKLELIPVHTPV